MKKAILIVGCFLSCCCAIAQNLAPDSDNFIKHVYEVYGVQSQDLIFNDADRIKVLQDLYENRIIFQYDPVIGEDKTPKLGQQPILDKFNSELKRDALMDVQTLNPLKYNLNFYSMNRQVYRVDGTDYLMVIEPFNPELINQ